MRVSMNRGEIAVGIVRNWIAASAPNHTGFIGAFLVNTVGLPNGGINSKIGSGYTAASQVSTSRTGNRISRFAHFLPIVKYVVSAAFIIVKRHDKSSILRHRGSDNDLIPLFAKLSPRACEIGL
jgi:hypothetical protein